MLAVIKDRKAPGVSVKSVPKPKANEDERINDTTYCRNMAIKWDI